MKILLGWTGMQKMFKQLLVLFSGFLLLFSVPEVFCSFSSEPEWIKTIGGPGDQIVTALSSTEDGGYVLVGYVDKLSIFGPLFVIKLDVNGNQEWNKTNYVDENQGGNNLYILPISALVSSIVQTEDCGYAMVGSTNYAGDDYIFLMKIDCNGTQQWFKRLGTSNVHGKVLVQTDDGGYAIVYSVSVFTGHRLAGLMKTDANGTQLWNKTFGGDYENDFESIFQTEDGGYVLAGSFEVNQTFSNPWLIKTDAFGNVQWNRTYSKDESGFSASSVETGSGDFVLMGITSPRDQTFETFFIKTDPEGNLLWRKTAEAKTPEQIHSFVETAEGGYMTVGKVYSRELDKVVIYVTKTDDTGNIEWNQTYGEILGSRRPYIAREKDGSIVIAGNIQNNSTTSEDLDILIIKLPSETIPEFSSWIILPMALTATLLVITYRKKFKHSPL